MENESVLFCQEVEKHPCLYNPTLPASPAERARAWAEIGEVMLMTGSDCKDKWKAIRGRYVAGNKNPKIPYYLAEHLKFLEPYRNDRGCSNRKKYSGMKIFRADKSDIEEISTQEDEDSLNPVDGPLVDNEGNKKSYYRTLDRDPTLDCPECQEKIGRKDTESDKNICSADVNKSEPDAKRRKLAPEETDDKFTSGPNNAVKSILTDLSFELGLMDHEQFKMFKRKVLTIIDDIMKE